MAILTFPPGAPSTATYLTQVAEGGLSAEQAMAALATGLVKNTTTTGVQSIGVAGTDYAPPLTYTAGGANAAQAMAVNTVYFTDISAYTAERTYTLPAVAAVGDLCGILITTGDDSYELLITATAGDTLNGVAGGTEWSRLMITGEAIMMRCVVANTTWIVELDGRIPMVGLMELTTQCDGETAATLTVPTAAATPGAWTAIRDVGNMSSVGTSLFTTRRAGDFQVTIGMRTKDNGTSGNYVECRALSAGSVAEACRLAIPVPASDLKPYLGAGRLMHLAVDDTITYTYATQAGGLGLEASTNTFFSVSEVL